MAFIKNKSKLLDTLNKHFISTLKSKTDENIKIYRNGFISRSFVRGLYCLFEGQR